MAWVPDKETVDAIARAISETQCRECRTAFEIMREQGVRERAKVKREIMYYNRVRLFGKSIDPERLKVLIRDAIRSLDSMEISAAVKSLEEAYRLLD